MLRIVDLFAGVGGLSYGFQEAGFKVIIANEIDSDIAYSYSKNHKSTKMINEDVTKLDIDSVFKEYKGQIDVVIGGPPCQGFSQKGSRRTINDERNFLFRYYFKVVEYLRPKYFLMENVPNLITTENGLFIDEINGIFNQIGYQVTYDILNSADFGVPQYRKRAFILGKFQDIPPDLPIGYSTKISAYEAISDLEFLSSGEGEEVQEYRKKPQSNYQKMMRKDSLKLYNHVSTNHSRKAIEKLKLIPVGKGKEVLPPELLTKSIYSGTWSRIVADEPAVTVTTRFDTPSSGRFTHYCLNRCITVREAARLQSFPDKFIFYGSKSSQMKQVGNAVPPLLGYAIANQIKKDINR